MFLREQIFYYFYYAFRSATITIEKAFIAVPAVFISACVEMLQDLILKYMTIEG